MSAATKALKNIADIYPLTPMQEGLLFHTLLYPGSGMYLMQDRYLLEGTIDHDAFRRAWQQVVDRHCVLRTSFIWEDQKRPLQIVHKQVTAPVIELDWRGKSSADQSQELDALLKQELHTGFDFTKAPLLCLRLIRMTDRTYRFVRSYHHVLMDAWCFSLFMVDFFACYDAQARGVHKAIPRPRPYRDYIAWLQQQDPRAAEIFWRAYLRGFTVPTPLGIGEGAQQAGKDEDAIVADQMIHLSADVTNKLTALAQQHQLTLNTFVQGAWALILNRYSGEREVVFGVTVAGRPPELDGVESMLGLFINSLPLRVSIDPGAPILAWLKELLAQNVGMRQYEYAPLVQIQGWSEVPRGRSLFDSLLVFESAPVDPTLMAQAMPFEIQEEGNRTHTNYPLTAVIILGAELGLQISYNQQAFDGVTIARLLEHFQSVLEQMAEQPDRRVSDITMLRGPEQQQVTRQWNLTKAEYPAGAGMAELFAAQAERTPEAVAVQCGTETLTYAELDRQATSVAAGLEAAGVGPDDVVGVLAERSPSLVALILGVFKAGAGYLPLDPQHPAARWRQILTQGAVGVLLTQSALEDQVRKAFPSGHEVPPVDVHTLEALLTVEPRDLRAPRATHPDQVAYVIFTSGSTGTPKGAMVTQQGMINNVWGKGPTLGLTAADVVAQTASACFDISVWQLLSALLWGGRVEIISDEIVRDPPRLLAELARTGATVAELVPSLLREVVTVDPAVELPRLRWLLPTGEAVTSELCRSWFVRYPMVPMLNAYGPAECADDVAYHIIQGPPRPDDLVVPIGRPAANLRLYILTAELDPVPVGISGELCVGGVGVGRGYLQEPGRTAERFVPDPFGAKAGARLYRTGDIGRHRADGTIEFLGRRDHQVKVRGYRIELGEIEAALAQQPGVEDQVVVVREAQPGKAHVVAYVVGEAGRQPEQLRRALRERLPEYMVPSLVVSLEALPLTPNGKVDRKALPAPEGGGEGAVYVPLQTLTEELLAGIWGEVLGRPRVSRSDNFFDLGGHSLLATQIMSRVRNIFQLALPLRTVFDCPTIVEFARVIESARRKECDASVAPLVRVGRTQCPPLSFAQERLWLLDQLEPESSAYNLSTAVRLRGTLNITGLRYSLQALVKRHEALRTSFVLENNLPVQVIAEDIPNILTEADLSGGPLEARDMEVRRIVAEEERRPFSLSAGGLLRAKLLRLEEEDHVLLITMHHIVSDGWSMGIFIREMIAVYQAFVTHTPITLPEMPIQYADFAIWQRAWLSGTVLKDEIRHWKTVLAGVPPFLALPTDRIRPAVQTYRGAAHRFTLPTALSKQLASVSRTEGVTLFMTLLAAFQLLLARYSGQDDFCIGTPVANRNRLETEGLIGFFVNTLVLRSCVAGDPTCQELLKRIREMVLDAQAHQDVPFEKIVEELQPQRSLSYSPLFQTLFVLQNTGRASLEIPALTVDSIDVEEQSAKFDVTLECIETEEGVSGSFIYCSDLFDEATIVRMAGHFQTLLEGLAASPKSRVSELTLLTEAERHRLETTVTRATHTTTDGLCVHQAIEKQAEQTPHAVAVTCGASSLTYGELNAKANQLARYLRSLGVGPDVTVGVCLERSVEVMVGVLGILKAGGAYVAMDPAYPQHRRDYMLKDSRARWLVAQKSLVRDAANEVQVVCLDQDWSQIAALDSTNLSCVTAQDNLLYLIYTSGSTGLPKGSGVTHRGARNLLTWYVREFGMRATDRVLVMSALGFDLTQKNMFAPLVCGGQVIFPDLAGYDDQYLREIIHERAITWVNCTPSAFYPLVEGEKAPRKLSSLRQVFLGGESIDHARLAPWMASSDCEVVNMYGPTECTDIAAFYRLNSARQPPFEAVPIGIANDNVLLQVLDRNRQLVPVGVPGELYIGGAGVSRGYQHQPAMTADKFVPNRLAPIPAAGYTRPGISSDLERMATWNSSDGWTIKSKYMALESSWERSKPHWPHSQECGKQSSWYGRITSALVVWWDMSWVMELRKAGGPPCEPHCLNTWCRRVLFRFPHFP